MSLWTARLIAPGGRTTQGNFISPATLQSLVPLLRDAPVCIYFAGAQFAHPAPGAKGYETVNLDAIVGCVEEVALKGPDVFGRVSIGNPHVERLLLNLERRGRLIESCGLSVHGRALTLPPEYDEPGLLFLRVISVDLVDVPLSGGHLLQSDAAGAAGRPWPALPTLRPVPRPARTGSNRPLVRAMACAPLSTEFRELRPGEGY